MNWKRVLVPLAGLPVIALLAYGLTRDPKIVDSTRPGLPAPDFVRATLAGGDSFRLSSLRGHAVVLNFWASWCIPCLQEHPLLVAADERWHGQGLRIVGVVYQDTPANAQTWMRERGGTWTNVLDPGSKLSIEYGLFGVPETFFIDRRGVVAHKQIGPVSADVLAEWITRLLADSASVTQ